MYATVADMRAEGVTASQASDERLTALIEEASRRIDRATGWFFEPRERTYHFDGRGTPTIDLPVPLIRLDDLVIDQSEIGVTFDNPMIIGAPVQSEFEAPHITFRYGHTFTRGRRNIRITGLWGYTEDDGTFEGRTPLEIRRACMLLVLRGLPPLADTDATDEARHRWRVVTERTRDQSYTLDRARPGPFTGDPEIDHILLSYRRPPALGAV